MPPIREYTSRLPMDHLGRIPEDRQEHFYRVETWNGRFVADFALKGEAHSFAIEDARASGCRYDHKVSPITLKRP